MSVSHTALLKNQVKAFLSTIQSARPEERRNTASAATEAQWNKILDAVAEEFADLKKLLPEKTFPTSRLARHSSMSDQSFMDLEIAAGQVLSLLELMED